MQYRVDDVAKFDGPGCASVWWEATYSSPADRDFCINVELTQRGSNSPYTDYEWVSTLWDSETGTVSGSLCISDYEFDAADGPAVFAGSIDVKASSLQQFAAEGCLRGGRNPLI